MTPANRQTGEINMDFKAEREAEIAKVNQYWWQPEDDITVYELALASPMIGMLSWFGKITQYDFLDECYAALPPEAQRHWIVQSPTDASEAAARPAAD
ncbi:MAG: hypothetical protein ACOH2N_00095 [Devosia sp.]